MTLSRRLVFDVEYLSRGDNVNRLREVMDQKGITQTELAKITGIHQSDISKIVNDKKQNLSLGVAKRIAKALGRSVDFLWPG